MNDHHRPAAAPLDRAGIRAIAQRYTGRYRQGYARGKLGGDPAYAAVAGLLATAPAWPLLDIGCGVGLLGQYLHACGRLHGYLGIDLDRRRIAAGQAAGAALIPPLQLRPGEASQLPAFHGHVAMLDMLHYLPAAAQATLLHEAGRRLAPGGLLIVRNVLRQANWRFHVTRLEEGFLRLTRQMQASVRHYPSAGEVKQPLQALGLAVTMRPLYGRTPFNSHLFVAQRQA